MRIKKVAVDQYWWEAKEARRTRDPCNKVLPPDPCIF